VNSNKPIKESLQIIAFECYESGASKWQVMKVLKEIENFQGTKKQLNTKVTEILAELNPEAAKTFSSFEKLKVFTSAEKRQAFDRGNIIKSLLKETKISRAIAKTIGSEVEDKIKDLQLDYLNTSLIREMVNVKLLDYGHEPVHGEYARLGLPIFEVKKKLEQNNFENKEILREYNWLSVINKEARELHFDSIIHIFYPEDFSTKIHSCTSFFNGVKEDLVINAKKNDLFSSEPSALKAFNFSLNLEKKSKKIIEEINILEKLFSLTGKKRIVELALFNDFEWQKLSSRKKNAITFAQVLLERKNEFFTPVLTVDSKYQLKLLKKNYFNNVLITNNSKTKVNATNSGITTDNSSILLRVGLNLVKLSAHSEFDENELIKKIEEIVLLIQKLAKQKKDILEKRNYVDKQILNQSQIMISLAGLFYACNQINENAPHKVSENIISALQKKGIIVNELNENKILKKFGITENKIQCQEMLLKMNQKCQRTYGFIYFAKNEKQLEELLTNSPAVITHFEEL